jgi:transcriptional regulator with GAF, ATPase, and Fis domain
MVAPRPGTYPALSTTREEEDGVEAPESPGGWGERSILLARRFVALADTLVDDFDVLDLMDHLVRSSIELLDVEAAGLLLRDSNGRLTLAASSSEESRLLELFQLQSEQGPCLDSVAAGRSLAVDDLSRASERWPEFSKAADTLGFVSAYAFPLRLREHTIGGLNLFGKSRRSLHEADRHVGQALADMAAIGLLQHETRLQANRLAEQLQGALDTRVVIEQAKGVLAEFAQIDMESAFGALRQYSRDHNRKLSEVAKAVAHRALGPHTVFASRRS